MTIKITKLTGLDLLRKANSFTTGHDSGMSLATAYRHGHSPIRTQLFCIELSDIPLFVASQLVRSHIGVQWYQRSKRTDRGGSDFEYECEELAREVENNELLSESEQRKAEFQIAEDIRHLPRCFDRYAPTDLMCIANAEAIINISHKRLCAKASKETREIWQAVCELIDEQDPDLFLHLVPQCIFRGVCPEPCSCGYLRTPDGQAALATYQALFK